MTARFRGGRDGSGEACVPTSRPPQDPRNVSNAGSLEQPWMTYRMFRPLTRDWARMLTSTST